MKGGDGGDPAGKPDSKPARQQISTSMAGEPKGPKLSDHGKQLKDNETMELTPPGEATEQKDSHMNSSMVDQLVGTKVSVDDKQIEAPKPSELTPRGNAGGHTDSSNLQALHGAELPLDDDQYADLPQDCVLTRKDLSTIEHIKSIPSDKNLVQIDHVYACKLHMQCLLDPNDFVNGVVMSCYINCLRSQPHLQNRDGGKVFLEDTYVSGLIKTQGEDDAEISSDSWLVDRVETYLQHDMVFLPINIKNSHWHLAVLNAPRHEIQILDSLCWTNNRSDLDNTMKGLQFLLDVLGERNKSLKTKWKDLKVTTWKRCEQLPKPLQGDGFSCGLFVLKFMEYWSGIKLSHSVKQEEIVKFRLKLAALLVRWKSNTATTAESENEDDTGTDGVEYLGSRPAKRRRQKEYSSSDMRYASLLDALSMAGEKELIGCLGSIILSIDDPQTLEKTWVKSSMPYPISLSARAIKGLLNEREGLDADCFNIGVRKLVQDERRMMVTKHYMDLQFCTLSQLTKQEKYRTKVDVQQLAKTTEGWPGLPYDASLRKMVLMMPIATGGRFTLYVFDEKAKKVFILDPKPTAANINKESQLKLYGLKIQNIKPNLTLARQAKCPKWNEDVYVMWDHSIIEAVSKSCWELSGFLVWSFMRAWNGAKLRPLLSVDSNELRRELLGQLLTFEGNECEANLPSGLRDLLSCIKNRRARNT